MAEAETDFVHIETDRGLWRPNAEGYTGDPKQAGVWSRKEAEVITAHLGPEKRLRLHVAKPSTNQTDLAGREWRTTSEARAEARQCLVDLGPIRIGYAGMDLSGLLDDLETALAKIAALEAERDEARSSATASQKLAELRKGHTENERLRADSNYDDAVGYMHRAEAAEARATALEGALEATDDQINDMRAALRPFAKYAEKRDRTLGRHKTRDDAGWITDIHGVQITVGDLRRAAAALLNPDPAEQPEAGR